MLRKKRFRSALLEMSTGDPADRSWWRFDIARGTQKKILKAMMASGAPVVAIRVAAGGVDAVANEHFLLASTPKEYAQVVLQILGAVNWRGRRAR